MSQARERFERLYEEGGREAVVAALATEPALSAFLLELDGLDAALQALPKVTMPVDVEERIAETVTTLERPRVRRAGSRRLLWRTIGILVPAAAAVIAVLWQQPARVERPTGVRLSLPTLVAAPPQAAFRNAGQQPRSSFPLLVGDASLGEVRRAVKAGTLPSPDQVRIEELVNAFHYDDPEPPAGEPLAVSVEAAPCPWGATHALVRVGVRATGLGPEVAAEDAKVEVVFDTAHVASYRLLGRGAVGPVASGAGVTLHRGHAVSALYEVALHESDGAWPAGALLEVRLSYQRDGAEKLAVAHLAGATRTLDQASRDLRFSAAVALLGIGLGGDPFGGVTPSRALLDQAVQLAEKSGGAEPGERADLVRLAEQARALLGG